MAKKSATSRNDVDLALYVTNPTPFSFDDKLMLHGNCCWALARNDFALVMMNQPKNLILLDEIIRTGEILSDREPAWRKEYEATILHHAIDFKTQRYREGGR